MNSELSYSIANIYGLSTADGVRYSVSDSIFNIDSLTAELYVNSDLEREVEEDGFHYYEMTVRSNQHDHSQTGLTCFCVV